MLLKITYTTHVFEYMGLRTHFMKVWYKCLSYSRHNTKLRAFVQKSTILFYYDILPKLPRKMLSSRRKKKYLCQNTTFSLLFF